MLLPDRWAVAVEMCDLLAIDKTQLKDNKIWKSAKIPVTQKTYKKNIAKWVTGALYIGRN